jgi:hypothetical protein
MICNHPKAMPKAMSCFCFEKWNQSLKLNGLDRHCAELWTPSTTPLIWASTSVYYIQHRVWIVSSSPINKHNTYHIQHRVFDYFPIPTDKNEMLRHYKLRDHFNASYWGRPIKVVFFYWHFWRALYLVHKFIIFHFLFNHPNSPNGNECSFKSYYHVNKIESRLLEYAHVGGICTL